VRYIDSIPMQKQSETLRSIVEATEPRLRAFSAAETFQPILHGGWSRRQVLGHLIDSASNNHQRFVRAALAPSLDFPAYDQNGNIRIQAPEDADWELLVSLWAAYNRYLAHIIARLPAPQLATPCRIGGAAPVTFEFLVDDYLVHLTHHLDQLA